MGAPGTTKGPWHLSPFEPVNGGNHRVVMGADGFAVAHCMGRSAEEHDLDAAQIIASPDMYDALRGLAGNAGALRAFEHEIRDAAGNTNWQCLMDAIAVADAALAKARGK